MIDHADLWLFRHGLAVDPEAEVSDAEDFARPLTKEGVRQSINAGVVLRRLADVEKVYASPRVRTVQSAALAVGMGFKRDKALDHGKPGAALEHGKDGRVTLVVGHHVLSDGIEKATGKTVELDKGAIAKLECRDGQWKLARLLSPADVRKLAR